MTDSVNGNPISDVTCFVTYSDGSTEPLISDDNGLLVFKTTPVHLRCRCCTRKDDVFVLYQTFESSDVKNLNEIKLTKLAFHESFDTENITETVETFKFILITLMVLCMGSLMFL